MDAESEPYGRCPYVSAPGRGCRSCRSGAEASRFHRTAPRNGGARVPHLPRPAVDGHLSPDEKRRPRRCDVRRYLDSLHLHEHRRARSYDRLHQFRESIDGAVDHTAQGGRSSESGRCSQNTACPAIPGRVCSDGLAGLRAVARSGSAHVAGVCAVHGETARIGFWMDHTRRSCPPRRRRGTARRGLSRTLPVRFSCHRCVPRCCSMGWRGCIQESAGRLPVPPFDGPDRGGACDQRPAGLRPEQEARLQQGPDSDPERVSPGLRSDSAIQKPSNRRFWRTRTSLTPRLR